MDDKKDIVLFETDDKAVSINVTLDQLSQNLRQFKWKETVKSKDE